MISREYRFHSYSSVQRVYQRGTRVRGLLMSLQYMINGRRQTPRIAVVVSRKVNKSAVKRNRIRRRLYEVIRSCQSQISQPYDIVFTVYNEDINKLSETELSKLVCGQLQSAHILAKPSETSQHVIVGSKDS
jgi:ribonuclease P protein component